MDCDDADDANDAMRAELQSFGQGSMTHTCSAVQSAASHFRNQLLAWQTPSYTAIWICSL